MTMKIIFLCSDPKILKGEEYTSSYPTFSSIKTAAYAAMTNEHIIQAIDINDLSDVEDVTQQVAEALTTNRFINCDTVPQYALNVDMHDFIAVLEAAVAEDNTNQRDAQSKYAQGAL